MRVSIDPFHESTSGEDNRHPKSGR